MNHNLNLKTIDENPLIQESNFGRDVLDLFSDKKSAHLLPYTYSYGANLWADYVNTSKDYYIIHDEMKIIKDNAEEIASVLGGVTNIVDLGPGSKGAIEGKTIPIMDEMKDQITSYAAIDVSREYLTGAREIIKKHFPDIKSFYFNDNFFKPLNLGFSNKTAAFLFGVTLTNMPGITDMKSGIEFLKLELQQFRELLPVGSYLLCSFDCCQDGEKVMNGYYHPKHATFCESLTRKMKQELNFDSGFDETAFRYNPKWDSKNSMLHQILTTTKDMKFKLNGQSFEFPENHDFITHPVIKFPKEVFFTAFEDTGFIQACEPFMCPDEDVVISVLKVS